MDRALISCDNGLRRDSNRLLFRHKGGAILVHSKESVYRFELELAVPGFFVYCPRELGQITATERERIIQELRSWLAEVGYLPEPTLPIDYSEEEELCLMAGCARRRVKGRYLCRVHFDATGPDPASALTLRFLPAQEAV